MRFGALLLAGMGFLGQLGGAAYAQGDLDVEGARRRYEAQQQVADRAKAQRDIEASRLNSAESRLRSAQQDEQTAQSRLRDAESRLDDLDRQVQRLQNEISRLESDLPQKQRDQQRAEQDARQAQQQVRRLEEERGRLDNQIERVEARLRELRAAPEPDQAEIARGEAALQRLQSEKQQKNGEINQAEREYRQEQNRADRLANEIRDIESSIRSKRNELDNADRSRDRIENDISQYRQDLRRAEDEIRRARSEVDSQRSVLASAENNYQQEQSRANELHRYYQQVVDNYNRELNRIYAVADRAANDHASAEANERAPQAGTAQGSSEGQSAGSSKGTADGRARDRVLGYRHGRANANSDASLADFYARGRGQGSDIADRKALGEDFPRGYNEALAEVLAAVPTQQETLDIGQSIPDDPGANSPELSSNQMPRTPVANPGFAMPQDPGLVPPTYQNPQFSVPSRDNRYHNPPCSNLALEEFVPKCRARYDAAYSSLFGSAYQRLFLAAHRPAFENNARSSYDAAVGQTYRESFADGSAQGATEQGVLDGFAERLAVARQQKHREGIASLQQKAGASHLLVVRSVTLQERDGDGVLSPGEFADIIMVVDNLGGAASPKSKLKLEVKSTTGVQQVTFNTRELPAIAAHTRMTLVGVTRVQPKAIYAGSKLTIEGQVLSKNGAGAYVPVQSFTQSATVNYPLELQDIALEKDPAVGETVKAKFTFKNLSNVATEEAKTSLSTSPAIVEVIGGADLVIPALQPGETSVLEAQVKPGVWVGENAYVNFLSKLTDVAGVAKYAQPFGKYVHINRAASINIYDAAGKHMTDSTIDVTAGSTVSVVAKFIYHATQSRRGPFVLRSAKMSHPQMRHANGSTTSINYGSWSPGRSADAVRFSYVVPAAAKGTQVNVMLTLQEGATIIHAPMIYMNVK